MPEHKSQFRHIRAPVHSLIHAQIPHKFYLQTTSKGAQLQKTFNSTNAENKFPLTSRTQGRLKNCSNVDPHDLRRVEAFKSRKLKTEITYKSIRTDETISHSFTESIHYTYFMMRPAWDHEIIKSTLPI